MKMKRKINDNVISTNNHPESENIISISPVSSHLSGSSQKSSDKNNNVSHLIISSLHQSSHQKLWVWVWDSRDRRDSGSDPAQRSDRDDAEPGIGELIRSAGHKTWDECPVLRLNVSADLKTNCCMAGYSNPAGSPRHYRLFYHNVLEQIR